MPKENFLKHLALDGKVLRKELIAWLPHPSDQSVMAFIPEAEADKVSLLQLVCRELGISLFGGIFPALIVNGKFSNNGVLLVHFGQRIPIGLITDIDEQGSDDAKRISQTVFSMLNNCADSVVTPTLFLIFDGTLPNIGSILDEIYSCLAERVRYAGANAGSETFTRVPCVFNECVVVDRGLLVLLLPHVSTPVLAHGYRHPTQMLSATATTGNRIAMIDWQPAFFVYQHLIKEQYGIELTKENFYAYAVHFPFGILRANLELVVRTPVILEEDGSLLCAGEVPENSILVLLQAPSSNQDGCINQLAQTLLKENGVLQGRNLMTFYCAGRKKHLDEGALAELNILREDTGVKELFGALSQGEVGSTQIDGYPMSHNATLVCTPWTFS